MLPHLPARSRRVFLRDSAALGLGSLGLATPAVAGHAADTARVALPTRLPDRPDRVFVEHGAPAFETAAATGPAFASSGAGVRVDNGTVFVSAPAAPLSRVVLRWDLPVPTGVLLLGDHWERGYGDLQWRTFQPERLMPWYVAAHLPATGETWMIGVATQPAALCGWVVDEAGVSLWLDFRNGGSPSLPGRREIAAARLVSLASNAGESPMAALRRFCAMLCPRPRPVPTPVCGNNNWYYSYGRDFDAAAIRRDAALLADLAAGHAVKPFCVIDAGWTPGSVCPGGPWTAGDRTRFPDMPGLAAEMKQRGVRPGIWMRPTALMQADDRSRLRPLPTRDPEQPLDLTRPENLALIRDDVARIQSWGYELIKHDFSTYDAFGRWGFQMGAEVTDQGWSFADRSLTNAEILLRLYRTLREAAGDALLLGCNTIGHLGAGLFEVQRTGDDTSGRVWERTRRMGVNTLAFRLPQHGTFFVSDADCAAHTAATPWALDWQFLDLVARSGTALFVSVDPRTITDEVRAVLHAAMQTALSGGTPGGCEPLDWLQTTAPRLWRFGSQHVQYAWDEPMGPVPLTV